MPRLSAWFVRASLIYLLLGFILGALLLAQKGISYDPGLWVMLPIHMELLLAGWLLQLAFGVAFWILPRFGVGAARGREGLIGASFVLLNAGIVLVCLQLWLPPVLLIGRFVEMVAVLLYAIGSWKRVKPMAVQGTSTS